MHRGLSGHSILHPPNWVVPNAIFLLRHDAGEAAAKDVVAYKSFNCSSVLLTS